MFKIKNRSKPYKSTRFKRLERQRLDGENRSNRKISLEAVVEEDNLSVSSALPFLRVLTKSGTKARFLVFAILFAFAITALSMYLERYESKGNYIADYENASQVSLGRGIYTANCAFCHGDHLEGKRGWDEDYPKGNRPPLPLNGKGPISRLSDRDLFDITKFGGQPFSPLGYKNDMPGFELQLNDTEIWSVLAFIKSHWSERDLKRQIQN